MEPGGFYGDRRHGGEHLDVGAFEPPVAWTPKHINNSSGLITYAGDERWGPLAGQWILGSYGQSTLFAVMMEKIGEGFQGGIVKLPVESTSGLMRGRVNPLDGQLYVAGLRGWQTLAAEDASFERIRYAGGNANLPHRIKVTGDGVNISFTNPVDVADAGNKENFRVERWDYLYTERYGSSEVLPDNPAAEGRDTMVVSGVMISEKGKDIFLEIPDMRSVMQMKIAYAIRFDDGEETENAIYHTVNWLSEDEADEKPEWQQRLIANRPGLASAEDPDEQAVFAEGAAPEWYQQGAVSFQRNCMTCHVSGGVAPSMESSQWAAGTHEALVRILLHGKLGNRGVMTPFAWMDDEEVATIVSYIRAQWHEKDQVTPAQVEQIRNTTRDRTDLWTEEELSNF